MHRSATSSSMSVPAPRPEHTSNVAPDAYQRRFHNKSPDPCDFDSSRFERGVGVAHDGPEPPGAARPVWGIGRRLRTLRLMSTGGRAFEGAPPARAPRASHFSPPEREQVAMM